MIGSTKMENVYKYKREEHRKLTKRR